MQNCIYPLKGETSKGGYIYIYYIYSVRYPNESVQVILDKRVCTGYPWQDNSQRNHLVLERKHNDTYS